MVAQSTPAALPARIRYREAAQRLGVKPEFLRQLVFRREIPHYKVAKIVLFDVVELDEWFTSKRVAEGVR